MNKLIIVLFVIFTYNISAQNKTGCVSGNCKDGKGTFFFSNGDKYEGDFTDSHLNGFGVYTDAMGNVYTGNFKNDKFNGVGKFVRNDGTKYIGEFVDGKRNGLGTQWYSETYKEKGKWNNGVFIEASEFEDFVINEGYDFCIEFQKIFKSAVNNFNDVKGNKISEYIDGAYYCNVKIKELSTVEINDKNGYTGFYYKGDKTEGVNKMEELNKILLSCFSKWSCTFTNNLLNGVTEKKYVYTPASCSEQNLLKVKIEIICKIQGTNSEVLLHVTQPN